MPKQTISHCSLFVTGIIALAHTHIHTPKKRITQDDATSIPATVFRFVLLFSLFYFFLAFSKECFGESKLIIASFHKSLNIINLIIASDVAQTLCFIWLNVDFSFHFVSIKNLTGITLEYMMGVQKRSEHERIIWFKIYLPIVSNKSAYFRNDMFGKRDCNCLFF